MLQIDMYQLVAAGLCNRIVAGNACRNRLCEDCPLDSSSACGKQEIEDAIKLFNIELTNSSKEG